MDMKTPAPAKVCAEHIALTSFFYQVPAPVVRNVFNKSLIKQEDYVLPFCKERGLTEALAFLAKTKDGWDHIPAVCVEQNPAGTVLNVILAINKTKYTDGDGLLQQLKRGFEEIFCVLHDSQYDNPEVQEEIFTSIITMCSARVLCRLRLDRKATKMSIQNLLKAAMFSIRQISPQKLQGKELSVTSSLFISEANKVIKLVDQWLHHKTLDELGQLVRGIYHLQQTAPRFHDLIDLISNNDMDPSSRSSLLNIIRKVSRYWGTARRLYRTAKKYILVRNMKIQLASLPQKAFESQTNPSEFSDLCSCLSRLALAKGQQNRVRQLCHNLKLDEKAARARFEGAQKALSASKIHAEIQIVGFCEIKAPTLFPRVVSSSKDACFLCNTFIQLHGRMHTPKTHGRLYPGWRLPSLPQFTVLQQKLNQILLKSLQHNISLGLAQGKLPVHPFPNESTLLTSSASATVISIPELVSESFKGNISSSGSSKNVSEGRQRYSPLAVSQLSTSKTTSCNSINTVYLLEGGLVKDFVEYGRRSHLIITESLEVHLSLEHESASTTEKEPLGYGIKRMTIDSIKNMSETCPVIDVQRLEGEVLCSLSEDNAIFLVAGDVVLKLNTHRLAEEQKTALQAPPQ
ncbi:hypothetical protein N7495_003411 [Penicillium taxi]|uniref:uncharacterized protein n=1 Tax=Penicillium taxi TaxID=168475 RepID=UPI00254572B2|nr:uncharacterized protein N7495_003411 [Penicillium taxi]KAJ5902883.1 hypothetical protein N7495_003411 [Penicillium taxi]